MLFGKDDECEGCCHPLFQRMTIVCRQRSIRQRICPRDQGLRQMREKCELSRPLQYALRPPLTPIHKRVPKSVTPIPISFNAHE